MLIKPLPYAQGNQLVVLKQSFVKGNARPVGFSVKELEDYRNQAHSLAQVEEYHGMSFILLDGQQPNEVRTGVVSAHYFDLLGIRPLLGRLFTEGDETKLLMRCWCSAILIGKTIMAVIPALLAGISA